MNQESQNMNEKRQSTHNNTKMQILELQGKNVKVAII